MDGTVKVYAVLTAIAGKQGELEQLLREMVGPSRAEEGNVRYDLWQDVDNPARFVLDELYRDEASAASHKASEHFQHYASRVGDLATRTPILVRPIDVR